MLLCSQTFFFFLLLNPPPPRSRSPPVALCPCRQIRFIPVAVMAVTMCGAVVIDDDFVPSQFVLFVSSVFGSLLPFCLSIVLHERQANNAYDRPLASIQGGYSRGRSFCPSFFSPKI